MKDDNNGTERKKNKSDDFEITELIMARAGKKDWNRCFYGTITREKDSQGKEISVSGKISINKGYIWSKGENGDLLSQNLDTMAELILDYDIHGSCSVTSVIACALFYHN